MKLKHLLKMGAMFLGALVAKTAQGAELTIDYGEGAVAVLTHDGKIGKENVAAGVVYTYYFNGDKVVARSEVSPGSREVRMSFSANTKINSAEKAKLIAGNLNNFNPRFKRTATLSNVLVSNGKNRIMRKYATFVVYGKDGYTGFVHPLSDIATINAGRRVQNVELNMSFDKDNVKNTFNSLEKEMKALEKRIPGLVFKGDAYAVLGLSGWVKDFKSGKIEKMNEAVTAQDKKTAIDFGFGPVATVMHDGMPGKVKDIDYATPEALYFFDKSKLVAAVEKTKTREEDATTFYILQRALTALEKENLRKLGAGVDYKKDALVWVVSTKGKDEESVGIYTAGGGYVLSYDGYRYRLALPKGDVIDLSVKGALDKAEVKAAVGQMNALMSKAESVNVQWTVKTFLDAFKVRAKIMNSSAQFEWPGAGDVHTPVNISGQRVARAEVGQVLVNS
ncbi:MAG: hypothetical protein LBU87_04870 [Lactobacillales bacterium]|jgi:hypothetical protein|nr:hypothetical protein [Lactobacillales bacterium]